MWVLVTDNTVRQLFDEKPELHEDLDVRQTNLKNIQEGWIVSGNTFKAPPDPEIMIPVPLFVSRRQFFQVIALKGMITEDEALAAVQGGAIPKALSDFVAEKLPVDQQFPAKMLLSGAQEFYRTDALVEAYGAAQNPPMDAAALDALWVFMVTL